MIGGWIENYIKKKKKEVSVENGVIINIETGMMCTPSLI